MVGVKFPVLAFGFPRWSAQQIYHRSRPHFRCPDSHLSDATLQMNVNYTRWSRNLRGDGCDQHWVASQVVRVRSGFMGYGLYEQIRDTLFLNIPRDIPHMHESFEHGSRLVHCLEDAD